MKNIFRKLFGLWFLQCYYCGKVTAKTYYCCDKCGWDFACEEHFGSIIPRK